MEAVRGGCQASTGVGGEDDGWGRGWWRWGGRGAVGWLVGRGLRAGGRGGEGVEGGERRPGGGGLCVVMNVGAAGATL